jgi:hypothetical protein
MKSFPAEILNPLQGVINALIFENTFICLSRTLFFQIEIPLEPINMAHISDENLGENQTTSFRLDWIKLNVSSLKELENKSFTFPINPEQGYIDGSIYLFDVHNIVDVTKITFGECINQIIPFKITLRIDFEQEGTNYATTKYMDFETELVLGELLISTDILNPKIEILEYAKPLVQQFIDIENFNEPFLGESGIALTMKL